RPRDRWSGTPLRRPRRARCGTGRGRRGERAMIATTLQEVAEITTGPLIGAAQPDAVVTGDLSIDSRTISPGGLFVARAGEYADGHDHVGAALAAGAVAAVVDHDVGDPAVLVADTEQAL